MYRFYGNGSMMYGVTENLKKHNYKQKIDNTIFNHRDYYIR